MPLERHSIERHSIERHSINPSHGPRSSIAYLVHTVYGPFIEQHVKILQVAELMPCMQEFLYELRGANTPESSWKIFDHHLKNSNDPDKYEQLSTALHHCHYKVLVCALNCGPVNFNQPAHSKMISLLTHDLLETFVASEIAEQLASRGVLSLHHFEFVKRLEHDGEKVEACFLLIDLLARQHESWYEHLLDVLNICQYAKLVADLDPTYYQKAHKLPTVRLSHVGQIPSNTDEVPKARLCLPRHCNAVRHSPQAMPGMSSCGCDRENARCSLKETHDDASTNIPHTGVHEAWKTDYDVGASRSVKFDNPIATVSAQCFAQADRNEIQTFEISQHGEDEFRLYRDNELNSASSSQNHDEFPNYLPTGSNMGNNINTQQEHAPQGHASLHLNQATQPNRRPVSLSQPTCSCQRENPVGQAGLINHGENVTTQPSYTNRERNSTYRKSYTLPQTFPTNRPSHTDPINHERNSHYHLSSSNQDHHPTNTQQVLTSQETVPINWSFPESEEHNSIGQTNTTNYERKSPNSHQMYVNVNLKRNSAHGRNSMSHETWRALDDKDQNHIGPTEPSWKEQASSHTVHNEVSHNYQPVSMYQEHHSSNEPSFVRDRQVSTSGQGSMHHEQGADSNPGCACNKRNSYGMPNHHSHITHTNSSGADAPNSGADSKLRQVTLSGLCREQTASGQRCSLNHTQFSSGNSQEQNAADGCQLNCCLHGYISLLDDDPTGNSSSYLTEM